MHHKANWTQPSLLSEITGVMKVRCVYPDSVLKKGADHTEQWRLYDNYYNQTSGQKESFLQRWDSIQKFWISAHKKKKKKRNHSPLTLPPHARWFLIAPWKSWLLTPFLYHVLNHSQFAWIAAFSTFTSVCICASMCCCHLSFMTPRGWAGSDQLL